MQVVAYGLFVLGLILGMFLYLLPAIIADMRDAEHATAITWVNLLFGWTVLGWVAALIWACVEKPEPEQPAVEHREAA
jgi:uncharacterized membrane protein